MKVLTLGEYLTVNYGIKPGEQYERFGSRPQVANESVVGKPCDEDPSIRRRVWILPLCLYSVWFVFGGYGWSPVLLHPLISTWRKREMSVKHDPETYAAMMAPHESLDALNEAITEFYEGVSELRKLHRITDVEIVVQAFYKAENGESVVGTTRAHFGSSAEQVPMLAWALGTAQTKRREEEAKLLGGKK